MFYCIFIINFFTKECFSPNFQIIKSLSIEGRYKGGKGGIGEEKGALGKKSWQRDRGRKRELLSKKCGIVGKRGYGL